MSRFVIRLLLGLADVYFASWAALFAFIIVFRTGLFNTAMMDTMAKYAPLNESLSIGKLLWDALTGETALALKRAGEIFLALLCGPIAFIALVGEIMAWRHWGFYIVGTAIAIAASVFAFVAFFWTSDLPVFPGIIPGLMSVGIVAGAVYWLIAGRRAGRTVTP